MSKSTRHTAREAVLRALYMSESRNISVDEAFHEMEDIDREIALKPDAPYMKELRPFSLQIKGSHLEFAKDLAHRVVDNRDELSDIIRPFLKNWDFERINRIDRLIMWIALAEMRYLLDIPVSVTINEAVELAKSYGSSKSPGFINGILDRAAREIDGNAG